MQSATGIAIVLLNWNASAVTCKCLERLQRWKRLRPQIYVVDNDSTDGSVEEITHRFPDVYLVRNKKNKGFAGGNNAAFHQIFEPKNGLEPVAGMVLLLNNDAGIEEKDVLLMRDALTSDNRIGIIGPLLYKDHAYREVLSPGGLDPATNGKTYSKKPDTEQSRSRGKDYYPVDYVSGTVALMRSNLLQDVGLLDERYFFSCEMADWCERIKAHGYSCVVHPRARAWHDMNSDGKQRNTLYLYYSLRNRFLFIRKFRRNQQKRLYLFWIWTGAKGMGKWFLKGEYSSVRALFLALYHGVSGRWGDMNEIFLRS
jgi:GT2 family glycosyltransferase